MTACAVLLAAASRPARAQPWAPFAVPDSALAAALRAAGAGYEGAWNALLVAELRASAARADSAAALATLERRVAAAEPAALGTRIAHGALVLRARWSPVARARRVAAATAESAGVAAQRERRWADSDRLLREALAGYRAVGERRREAWVLGTLGSTWFLAPDYPRADSLYRLALAARRAVGDSGLVARAVNTLGTIAYLRGRDDEALGWFRHARDLRVALGERAGLVTTLNYMGMTAERQGARDTARAWFDRALALAGANGDSAGVWLVSGNLALNLANAGEFARADALWQRALALARMRGDVGPEARMRHMWCWSLLTRGRITTATDELERTLAGARAAGDVRFETQVLTTLGQAWDNLQDPERARPPLARAVALADSLGDGGAGARARNNLALAMRLAGDGSGAERRAREACALALAAGDSELVHDAAVTLGQIAALDRRDATAARPWFERAAAAGRGLRLQSRISDTLDLGHVAAVQERLDEAEALYRAALESAVAGGVGDGAWPALLGLGDVAERRGRFAEALDWDRGAAVTIDTLRARQDESGSVLLFSRRLFAYEALVHLLGRLDARFPDSAYAAEAFLWAERARARGLLDLARTGGATAAPLTLAQARGRLASEREALLEYSLGDSSSSLWVITRRAWRRIALPARPALRARAEALRRGLADPMSATAPATRAAARALYRTLVEPAEPLLGGVTRLVVSPDGPLARIPFEALLARDVPDGAEVPRGAWLVERYEIAYTPSAAALALGGARPAGRALIALGDPAFAPGSAAGAGPALPRLPETAAELATLGALAGTRPCTLLRDTAATRARLLAALAPGPPGVLHVATHGTADEVEPDRSGLWLAWDGAAPGFLSVGDVLAHRLGADLVTVSACETGLGRLERGEGVIGLARAFLAAGSRSVIVSQWKVSDRSTALLMQRFYRALLAQGRPRERALAESKRALLRDPATASPFHWAAFVLVGAGGPLP